MMTTKDAGGRTRRPRLYTVEVDTGAPRRIHLGTIYEARLGTAASQARCRARLHRGDRLLLTSHQRGGRGRTLQIATGGAL